MPPKRRTTTPRTTSATRQQSTLSFNGKGNRVSKASQQNQHQNGKSLDAKKKEALFDEAVSNNAVHPDEDDNIVEIKSSSPTTAEKAIAQQTAAETEALDNAAEEAKADLTGGSKAEDVLGGRAQTSDAGAVGGLTGSGWVGDEEARARKISEAQIKKFWRERESERLVPRVHQGDLDVHERVLRLWDVSGEFGVSWNTPLWRTSAHCALFSMVANENIAALHRHRQAEALEARKCSRPKSANRGSGCAAQGDGG